MTSEQKLEILKMRHQGQSYSQISQLLCISENTIKSYCRRNNLGTEKVGIKSEKETCIICKQCGKSLGNRTKGQPKKFCSEQCRRIWWKENKEKLSKKAFYQLTCSNCGTDFDSYGNKSRKFCSHSCYILFRFKGGVKVV